ncbi:MAG: transposase [Candidatus Cloacimonadota bacterium]|nr:MAG: transposase [Candidatus Cloacimonadota bacterium]
MIFEENGFYHIFNRGCNKENIFKEESDYRNLINRISQSDYDKYFNIIAYCLMPNHYHFLLQLKKKSISGWIRYIFNGYVQYFNHKYSRSGTLFEGRMKVKQIKDNDHLIVAIAYIHLNPVYADLATKPENWEFSNYQEWIGLRSSELYDSKFIRDNFDTSNDYLEFVKVELENRNSKESEIEY